MPSAAKKATKKKPTIGITGVSVRGFKSIANECRLDLRRLTIIAGANNSGKSSMLQPLLLLKQTLDLTYDPGPLWISGPNVRFSNIEQLLSRLPNKKQSRSFSVEIEVARSFVCRWTFKKHPKKKISLTSMTYRDEQTTTKFGMRMTKSDMTRFIGTVLEGGKKASMQLPVGLRPIGIVQKRFALGISVGMKKRGKYEPAFVVSPTSMFDTHISELIHIPAWRGNPERSSPTTAIGPEFSGVFPDYVASIINNWKAGRNERLRDLGRGLSRMGLTWKVDTKPVDDTRVEILVGRLPRGTSGGARDMVNIADVGFGVSQTLPLLVALLAAKPGQTVYVEEPEIHLHPKAQIALAQELVEAANRGVRLIIETHSVLLLLALQTLVAEGKIEPSRTKLYWFTRKPETGVSQVIEADLDDVGSFGDWPQDFGQVTLEMQKRYLNAAEVALKDR